MSRALFSVRICDGRSSASRGQQRNRHRSTPSHDAHPAIVAVNHRNPQSAEHMSLANNHPVTVSVRSLARNFGNIAPSPNRCTGRIENGASCRPSISSIQSPPNPADSGSFGSYHGAGSTSGATYGSCPRTSSRSGQPHTSLSTPAERYAPTRVVDAISIPPHARYPSYTPHTTLDTAERNLASTIAPTARGSAAGVLIVWFTVTERDESPCWLND